VGVLVVMRGLIGRGGSKLYSLVKIAKRRPMWVRDTALVEARQCMMRSGHGVHRECFVVTEVKSPKWLRCVSELSSATSYS
jgi:hypothetical protein